MAATLRLSDKEQETIRTIAIKVNKKLTEMEKAPLKDSELVHRVLEVALKNVSVNLKGEIEIN